MRLRLVTRSLLLLGALSAFGFGALYQDGKQHDKDINDYASRMLREGREIFRHDTFGSEAFWGDQVRLHEAIAGAANGGVGPGVSPKMALSLGLKVDMNAVPKAVAGAIKAGKVDLNDPKNTLLLLKVNAVVGVKGFFDGDRLKSVGITCAMCHSTVDDKFLPGIGNRLDGYPNRDLDVGKIVAAGPNLKPFTDMLQVDKATVLKVLNSWGPGKFDAELNLDGKAFRPDGKPAATLNPAALGLAGVNNHTWTGSWGTVTYWNAYVGNLEMHGSGTFFDPRLDDPVKYPVAARTRQGHKTAVIDKITAKLPALHFYQLSIPTPRPPRGTFNTEMAKRGEMLFNSTAKCASCHVPPIFTEPGWNLHKAEEIGIDDFQAMRAPDERYRTAPLRALWDMQKMHKGGFYHDGRFATLRAVIDHYDRFFKLNLSESQKRDLEEYLKSI
jgi:hypothetical protein